MQIEITNDMKEKSVWINYLKGDENHEYKCDAWKLKACWWIQDEEMKAKVTSEVKNKESECVRKMRKMNRQVMNESWGLSGMNEKMRKMMINRWGKLT